MLALRTRPKKTRRFEDLYNEISELKKQLEATSGDSEGQDQIKAVAQERDELVEKLKEYEVIEHDLANLKKFRRKMPN